VPNQCVRPHSCGILDQVHIKLLWGEDEKTKTDTAHDVALATASPCRPRLASMMDERSLSRRGPMNRINIVALLLRSTSLPRTPVELYGHPVFYA
jgi:hypothetical protein